ncbi:diguanylate cyclase (GGDEF) domain-containing protein [Franzmannia pantelleriensis]|uniref:diguanylate cyclase n=1 Tax=Franzmannia pantelleriensis TaxID=48727 RepID=A0A1G9EPA1_9GAMM|nr:diguanylate cyclase [Halomonas pantelleriensis]SDK77966.1 diguanylate cyclase (GGDEF) domain-containing protein [Halomonas pantelleriensis]
MTTVNPPQPDTPLTCEMLKPLLDHLSDGLALCDLNDTVLYANHVAQRLLGNDVIGNGLANQLIDDQPGTQIAIHTGVHLDITELPAMLGLRVYLLRDQGSRISAEQALARLRGLVEAWPDAVLFCDAEDLAISDANRAARDLLEDDNHRLTHEQLPQIFSASDAERLQKFLRQDLLSRRGALRRELLLRNAVPVEVTLIRLDEHQAQGRLTLMAMLRDRSHYLGKLRAVEHKLAKAQSLIGRDSLTGLHNRYGFDSAMEEFIDAGANGREFALLIGDIDHFKQINDRHGHQVGDEALQKVAQRIRDQLRDDDLVARYGGEEFCILVVCGGNKLGEIAERIRHAVASEPLTLDNGIQLPLTLSLGACQYEPGINGEALFERADDALYAAKEAGRNQAVIFQNT